MKAHIGVDVASGLVHTVRGTAANVADINMAGHVGAALLDHFLIHDWIRRTPRTRAVSVTPPGRVRLAALFRLAEDVF